MKKVMTAGLLTLPILLTGCGGGSGSVDSTSTTGTLNLSLTDAPIDEASEVVVEFSGVSIKKQTEDTQTENTTSEATEEDTADSSEWVNITFDTPVSINLLDLQGSQNYKLLSGQELQTGTYSEIRLHIHTDDQDGDLENYITLTEGGAQHEITIPSGLQTGLKVKGDITIPENGEAAFTIDFDVRKSIVVQGNGEYKLKPVLKLIQDELTGTISGSVATELLSTDTVGSQWSCSDDDVNSYNAVYLFSGTTAPLVDISETGSEPLSTALVAANTEGVYQFEFGYVPAGEYQVAFTCNADAESYTETDDGQGNITMEANSGDDLQFIGTQSVTVTAGQTTPVTITAPAIEAPPAS
ncbi:MAG: DUF4382 domain-containing protein [Thiomicrorhabdus chilensis]|uniref:DUF4382 domain-containing protein n=1 Tax=Thiomicrorhabdus chilensis TaxID=63656 RepID=UPI00299EBA51|nr:DUF4382 domain-containing protein [Thiomicrorhabdus chilensis]MDX1348380.1 DUF4382 domain-containing protein [Thiomicrorhabdus chilensis]